MDETEDIRRTLVAQQQFMGPSTREQLEQQYGQVWDTSQLEEDFTVIDFMAPFVIVRRKADNKMGSLEFQTNIGHRFYYNFKED